MCNAHGHQVGCTCGWGGEGHAGRSYGSTRLTHQSWGRDERQSPRVRPTSCPECGANVYFVRPAHGGAVWFDELGWPWPKHPCMDHETSVEETWQAVRHYLGTWQDVPVAERPAGLNVFHSKHKTHIRGCAECAAETEEAKREPRRAWARDRADRRAARKAERRAAKAPREAAPPDLLERLKRAAESGELNSPF